MRTVLTRILTAFLAASTTLSVSATPQVMKKAGGNANRISLTSTVKPQAAKAQGKTKGLVGLNTLQKRTPMSQFSLRSGATSSTLPGKKKIAYASASGLPEMYGSVIFADGWSNDNQPVGLYSVPTTAGESFNMVIDGPDASAGGVLVDGVYWTTNYFQFWGMVIVTVTGYDFESGEEVASYAGEIDNICKGVAVDPTSGMVYAITYNSNGDGFQLATIEYSETAAVTTAIGEFNYNVNSIAFDSTGQLYALVYNGETQGENYVVTESFLVKINKTNPADFTIVGETGVAPQYLSDSAIDTKTNRMFWAVSDATEESYMAEVDLTTGAATRILDFPLNEEVVGLVIPAPAAEDGAPAKVTGLAANFADGSMSGTIDFVAPTTLYDGSNGVGELTYTVLCDDETIATGATSFGATVNAAVTVAESGMHKFVVYCTNAAGDGPKAQIKAFVGKGVPAATTVTAEYVDGTANVAWLPVTESADGGYLNPAEVTYTVTRYPEGVIVADGITATTFSEPLAEPESIVSYTYGVKATYSGATSAEAISNAIVLGAIVPPYLQDFADNNGLAGFTIIDANSDGKTWMVVSGEARMAFNSSTAMDDWMITPPMKLEAGKAYKVSFKARSYGSTYPECIEAMWGTENTAAGMTNVLVEPTVLNSSTPVELGGYITPQADGTYFVGIHGISEPDMFYLYVDDIEISAGIAATAPGAATNLVVTPGANGAKTAAISFNAPTVDFAGNALASLEKVELYRGEELIHTFDAPAVGAELTYTDNLPADGDYTYTVICSNADGQGKSISATIYVGVDYPAAITEATLTEDSANPGKVTVAWTAVDKDVNGNPLSSALVKYDLYELNGNSRTLIAGDLTVTSYTFEAAAGEQQLRQYAVFPKTERGEGNGASTDMLAIGTPITNFAESFANGEVSYDWGIQRLNGNASWSLKNDSFVPSQDGDNGSIAMSGSSTDDSSRLFSLKISLAGVVNPALTFYTYNVVGESGAADVNLVSVGVSAPNANNYIVVMPAAKVDDLCGGVEGWGKVTVNLAEYAGQDIQFCIDATLKNYASVIFDNFKISSLVDNDLVATGITAPATVKAGADYTVDVVVTNDGGKDAGAYTVELYANNEKVAEKTGESLASAKSATVSFERTMSALATEPVTYKAIVVYAADEVLNNNETTEVAVAPIVSNLPKVTDLAASIADGGNKLTWSEPDLTAAAPEAITEDFEEATGFALEYGDWTFVDRDGKPVYGFQDMEIPNLATDGSQAFGFFIWDQALAGNQTFAALSGTKYLASLFTGQTQDDWAISPELYGGAQTIKFNARSYSDEYKEEIAVYYSTGSLDPKDFIKVMDKTVVPGEKTSSALVWKEYTVDLPEGAKYFAIVSCSTDKFMLMVDDVTFIPAGGAAADLSIVGYDIYRNGEKVNAEPVAECEYTDAAGKAGDVYQVTVIYNKGVSAGSNEAAATSALDELTAGVKVATAQGTIIVTGAVGLDVTVVAVDGKVLYAAKGDATVAVETGVYVVKAGDKIVKVLVK